ncbi:PspC domain-containing protein [Bifidobacterium margollesii]|uniref:PspC domain-containing protein n=1 Tax=Bifidobacterium margollesii TaxID=2020964 RepID=A0A2N5JC43_9BIFI|nr:PspC domain-containing protein [Bifidobacterium margollesii]PLS31774.1 PspC domain-containing protein [Bifidobacterium margollesii]
MTNAGTGPQYPGQYPGSQGNRNNQNNPYNTFNQNDPNGQYGPANGQGSQYGQSNQYGQYAQYDPFNRPNQQGRTGQPNQTGQPYGQTPYAQGPYGRPPRQALGSEFFNWIRSLNFYRSSDRWVGGVSGAIANRIGWDPLIIRIIWFAFFCAAGFGALLYGVAWMLMPDERDGTIVLEEAIVHGKFPSAFWLSLLFIIIGCPGSAFAVPFITIPVFIALIVAAIVLYNRDRKKKAGPDVRSGQPQPGPQSNGTARPGQQPGPQPNQPNPGNPYDPQRGRSGFNPGSGPTYYAGPQRTQPKVPTVVYRRRPAGPVVVGIASGLILISLAVLVAMVAFGFIPGEVSVLTLIAVWTLGITLALGLLTIVLGFMGRKAGGLIPITIVAVIASLCSYALLPSAHVSGATIDAFNRSSGYSTTLYSQSQTFRTNDWESLVNGGLKAVNSTVLIDLRSWGGSSEGDGLNYSYLDYRGCPTGELDLEAVNSSVTLIVDSGCATGIGDVKQAFSQVALEDSNGTRYSTGQPMMINRSGNSSYPWEQGYEDTADKAAYVTGDLVFSSVTVLRELPSDSDSSSSSNPYTD